MTFGEFIKQKRLTQKLSLRSFCAKHEYDHGNHSKLERGYLNPSDDDVWMQSLAKALLVKKDTSEWFEFYNLADIARRRIPKDLLNDAEVVEKLPVLFRTLQGDRLPPEKMDELIDFIRSRS